MIKTSAQSVGLSIIGLILAGFFAVKWFANPAVIDYPQELAGERVAELQKAIDPNLADEQTLSSIPGISKTVAKNIFEYREKFQEDHPGQAAFKTAEDLEPVKGIGPATLNKITPYLFFP